MRRKVPLGGSRVAEVRKHVDMLELLQLIALLQLISMRRNGLHLKMDCPVAAEIGRKCWNIDKCPTISVSISVKVETEQKPENE